VAVIKRSRVLKGSNKKTVFYEAQVYNQGMVETTKTEESARIIPLAGELVALLAEMRSLAAANRPVFADKHGGLLRYNAIQSAFNKGFKALELPWRSTHICWHTHATMMLLATGSLSAVQANLGHRSQRVTERYAKAVAALRTTDADKTAAMIRLPIEKSQTKSQTKSQMLGESTANCSEVSFS
jgi:integrase